MMASEKSALTLTVSSVAQHDSGTSKSISWFVTVYNTNLSSQCKLTAQIEAVQGKTFIFVLYN
jgi:hypothetical protein